jgi:hypothetical protein
MRFSDWPEYDRWYAQEIVRNALCCAKRNDGAFSQARPRKGSDGAAAIRVAKKKKRATQAGTPD